MAQPPTAAASAQRQDLSPTGPAGVDLENATIPELQRAMAYRRFTSVELTSWYLRRIRRLDDRLHAVATVNPNAMREAKESDERRRNGQELGVLDGIAVLLKDNVGTDDMPTTAGSLALKHAQPASAFIVHQLKRSGAVILGKANLSEWANFRSKHSSSGWSAVAGQTNNPYVLDRNPCGSSSGSAVAAAAHLAAASIGTETDGSIVFPAGQCGVVGLKPTLGLVSRMGIIPISHRQDTAGPIARNVTDAAVMLGALIGVDAADPATRTSRGYSRRDYASFLRRDGLRGTRIGVWRSSTTGVSPTTDRAFENALSALRDLEVIVVDPVDLPDANKIAEPEFLALLYEFKHDLDTYLSTLPGRHPRDLAELIEFNTEHAKLELQYFGQDIFLSAQETGGDLHSPEYLRARRTATRTARRAIDRAVETYELDAIVAPTNAPAWPTDLVNGDHFILSSSTPTAVAGYPNITVPMDYSFHLPIGMSIMGKRWQEPKLLSYAYAFEQATRVRRRPQFLRSTPISA